MKRRLKEVILKLFFLDIFIVFSYINVFSLYFRCIFDMLKKEIRCDLQILDYQCSVWSHGSGRDRRQNKN